MNEILLSVHVVFQLVPALWLIIIPFRNQLRFPFWATNLTAAGAVVLTILGINGLFSWLGDFTKWQNAILFPYLLFCIVLFLIMVKGRPLQMIFVLFVVESYVDAIALFCKSYAENVVKGYVTASYLQSEIIVTLITYPLMWLFMTRLLRPMINEKDRLPFWRYLWLVPVSYYVIYHTGLFNGYIARDLESRSEVFLLPVVWAVAVFLSYYVVLQMLSETAKNVRLQEKVNQMDAYLEMQKKEYLTLQSGIQQMRQARHDLRHHLAVLQGHLQNQDYAGLEHYLNQYQKSVEVLEEGPFCSNCAADAVIRYYVGQARANQIEISVSVQIPQDIAVSDSDFGILFGNLLENAVEACMRQVEGARFISLKAGVVGKKSIAITVENSFNGILNRSGTTFLSSKRSGEGIGVASVRSVAEKYHGIASFEEKDGIFSASVLLNL